LKSIMVRKINKIQAIKKQRIQDKVISAEIDNNSLFGNIYHREGTELLKYVCLLEDLSDEYIYCGGILLIRISLPVNRILEIIRMYLEMIK